MKIGTKRAVNTRLEAAAAEIEKRIQTWAAFANSGGAKCAQERMMEAVKCKEIVLGRVVPMVDEPAE